MLQLKLPEKSRPAGLFLFCNGCKKLYTNDKAIKCKCNRLVYKARVHISGTKHGVVHAILPTNNFVIALQLFHEFKANLENNSYQKIQITRTENTPVRLIECFAYYIGYLNNINVPEHKKKERDPKYIAKFDYLFEQYKCALEENGINWKILKFTEVNDDMVGFVHKHFLHKLNYSNKTYNNNMALLSSFTSHTIRELNFKYMNPFLGVPNMLVTPKVTSVRETEFEKLIELVTPENGIQMKTIKSRKNMKKTNHFKPWLTFGFKLGLYTGGRSEDVVELKWSDIQLDEKGEMDSIKTIDHKIDSAHNNLTSKDERFFKFFAITEELKTLLFEMGYEKYKNTTMYILAPEDGLKRTNVAGILSRSFSHYYNLLNTGREVTFRNLRKTFMTSAMRQFGESSLALTNHKTLDMTSKHYNDKEVTRQEAKQNFSVFKSKKN